MDSEEFGYLLRPRFSSDINARSRDAIDLITCYASLPDLNRYLVDIKNNRMEVSLSEKIPSELIKQLRKNWIVSSLA